MAERAGAGGAINILYHLIYFSPQPWKEIEAQRSEAAMQSHQEELELGF